MGTRGSSDMGQGEQEPTTQEETQHGSLCTQRGRILHWGGGITSGLAKAVVKDSVPPLPPWLRGQCPSRGATAMPGYLRCVSLSRATRGYRHMGWATPGGHRSPAEEGVLSGGAGEPQIRGAPPVVP